jgi:hypothetical protein
MNSFYKNIFNNNLHNLHNQSDIYKNIKNAKLGWPSLDRYIRMIFEKQ